MTRNLSIIVPTYNSQELIKDCLFNLAKTYPREIIVADNGSMDRTGEIVDRWRDNDVLPACELRIIRLPFPSKGAAVRAGMLAAKGDYCYMADDDLSTPAEAVIDFLLMMRSQSADVVIGSRRLKGSRVKQCARRRLSSFVFHLFTSLLLPEISDTQCGFKLFTREAAHNIFQHVGLTGLAFDSEVLLEAKRLGYKVVELPVQWTDGPHSRVRLVSDALKMTRDLWSLSRKYHHRKTEQALLQEA